MSTPRTLEEVIKKKAEEYYQLQIREKSNRDVTVALHALWEEAGRFCREGGYAHSERNSVSLNYCHVQVVYMCPFCVKRMQELHKRYYEEFVKRGWNP